MPASDHPSRFCSVCARQAGLNPAGYGGLAYDMIIAAELPLPWPRTLLHDAQRVPPAALAALHQLAAEDEHSGRLRARLLAIAPDRAYSQPDRRRVLVWRRPAAPFAHFAREEYWVPEPQLGALIAIAG